jgi:hypothetical protein
MNVSFDQGEEARPRLRDGGLVMNRRALYFAVFCSVLSLVVFLLAAVFVRSALGAVPAAGWTIDSTAAPTNFSTAQNAECVALVAIERPRPLCDAYQVNATNAGSMATEGSSRVKISDTLPPGVTVGSIELFLIAPETVAEANIAKEAECKGTTVVTCELPEGEDSTVQPDGIVQMVVYVTVNEPEAQGPVGNSVTVAGGGAPEATFSQKNAISPAQASFGPALFSFYIGGSDGAPDSQAGGHPYELTTTIDLNSALEAGNEELPAVTSTHDLKEVVVDLPLGFAGSVLAAPQCTLAQLSQATRCPEETRVGHISSEPESGARVNSPIWNLVPEHGVPAEFGFVDGDKNTHVFYVHVVPTPSGYVLQVRNPEIPQVPLAHIVVTFYGNPAQRDKNAHAQVPFFTNPSACGSGPLEAKIWMDSWQHPGSFNGDGTPNLEGDPNWVKMTSTSPPVTGCDELLFGPELSAQPTTSQADSPSGLELEMKLPQIESPEVRATPALKNASVTLPEGMTVDPSAGNGLQACSEAQIGWEGKTPYNFNTVAPACPEASKIGSLELETPLIPGVLTGAIYLANQNENPFASTLAGYIVVNDPVTGVVLKIAGELKTDAHTGRITGVFNENPQLPFSDLKLHFFSGPRASLVTPQNCGTYTTTSDLAPWSAPDSGADAMPFSSFQVNSGCVNGFAPAFTAGSTNLQAGAFSTLVVSFSRADTDQELAGATVSLQPGLSANLKSVPLCPEPQANAGSCPESTQVGTVEAAAGPGPNPIFEAGKAYLTGPYNNGPYGLSIVVPALAGPFNFGNVIVRQSLRIDPTDAHVTDVSDPFPTILDITGNNGQTSGIPIHLRRVDVTINRPSFTFNPTNCSKLQITSTLTSTQGATSTQATPYQVTNCASLKFAPKFQVTTSAHTSRENGASLNVKLTYPSSAPGTYTNIAKVKVDLPKQLPSRLTTLHQACLATTFETNPANCPPPSIVGHAKATVPNLTQPLEGPIYFVSHGGEAFPSLTFLLQGNNITIKLIGSTFIKNGITSTTFKTVPDAPVNTFEANFPQGKYSALAATTNLCTTKLNMPTTFTAQNGIEIHQTTKITTTNCPKHLTPQQKLAQALKACRKKHNHTQRTQCEQQAKKHNPTHTTKKPKKK